MKPSLASYTQSHTHICILTRFKLLSYNHSWTPGLLVGRKGGREGGRGGRKRNDSHVVISVYVSKECVTLKTAAATDNNINS